MAGVSAGAGTGKGTTATFVAPLTPGAEAQQSAVTVTLPQGGTNVSIAIGLTINGVIGDPTKPTIGFPFSWCKKTTVAPGEILTLPYILPAVGAAVATATLTVTQDEAAAPAPTLGVSALPFAVQAVQ